MAISSWYLIGLLAVIAVVPSVRLLLKGRVDLFEPLHWSSAYFFLLFVLRPTADLLAGSTFLGDPPMDRETEDAFRCALFLAVVAYLSFLFGYYSSAGSRLARVFPSIPEHVSVKRFQALWPALMVIGAVSFVVLVKVMGGWSAFTENKHEVLSAGGQGYLLRGVFLLQVGFVIAVCVAFALRSWAYGTVALVFIPCALLYGLASGAKGQFLSPLLAFLICSHYLRKPIRIGSILVFASLVVVSLPLFTFYRHASVDSVVGILPNYWDAISDPAILQLLIARFHGIDAITLIVRDTPQVMPFQYGATLLPILTVWIPRQLWEDKPVVSFGKVVGETYMADQYAGTGTAPSPTIIGEAYINWHVIGVVLFAVLAGIVVRALYACLIERRKTVLSTFAYALMFPNVFLFWERDLVGDIVEPLLNVAILCAVIAFVGMRRPVER